MGVLPPGESWDDMLDEPVAGLTDADRRAIWQGVFADPLPKAVLRRAMERAIAQSHDDCAEHFRLLAEIEYNDRPVYRYTFGDLPWKDTQDAPPDV